MKTKKTKLSGVFVVESNVHADARGRFSRLFCKKELSILLNSGEKKREIVQINHSMTADIGVVRGLHYQQQPFAEMKFIRCLRGSVWDVALDLRKDSATFKQWYGCELSAENNLMMVIPEGVAHGFQTLKPDTELLYLHTEYYSPDYEGGIKYDDPSANIEWPLDVIGVSNRDIGFPLMKENFEGLKDSGV